VEQQRDRSDDMVGCIEDALALSHGAARAAVAFLGCRLTLAHLHAGEKPAPEDWDRAQRFLQECLREDPDHLDALMYLAALRSIRGDRAGLRALAPAMARPGVPEPRFQYLAAVCHLAAGDYANVLQTARRAADDPELNVESFFLIGWAHYRLRELPEAIEALRKVGGSRQTPSADYARALMGQISVEIGDHEQAAECWAKIEPGRRSEWKLDEALRATILLAGLRAFEVGWFEKAAERFHAAQPLGEPDQRLKRLRILSLIRAGQAWLYGPDALAKVPLAPANRLKTGA